MAANKSFAFNVQGTGQFPFDMLRYDCCYPASSEDVCRMSPEFGWSARQVRLRSDKKPTNDRWRSFGWTVISLESVR